MDAINKVVVIFSVLGILSLYCLSSFTNPPSVHLEEISAHEGEIVKVKGVITDLKSTKYGNIIIRIREGEAEALIFVKSPDEDEKIKYGDVIEVIGKVEEYKGKYEIVTSSDRIKKIKSTNGSILFVSEIAKHPKQYEGKRIKVIGYVKDMRRNIFYLTDENGEYKLRVNKITNPSSYAQELEKRKKVMVEGVFIYNPEDMRYELNLVSLVGNLTSY
ncbi:MAG: OB-fold nucleic acid binding domain-containing protein [Candidatus Methanospirareceae archaeon]